MYELLLDDLQAKPKVIVPVQIHPKCPNGIDWPQKAYLEKKKVKIGTAQKKSLATFGVVDNVNVVDVNNVNDDDQTEAESPKNVQLKLN